MNGRSAPWNALCAAAAACGVAAALASGCARQGASGVPGDAERGRVLLRSYGCGSCHRIPGVAGADGRVGPPLEDIGRRAYLAGVEPNSPDAMTRWIREPAHVDPLTAMPDTGVDERDARDMTAYLYGLR